MRALPILLASVVLIAVAALPGCGSSRAPDDLAAAQTEQRAHQHRHGAAGHHADSTEHAHQNPMQGRMGRGSMGRGGMGRGRMAADSMGRGRMGGGGMGRMGGEGMGRGRMGGGMNRDGDMDTIHSLLADHEAIERRVVDLPNGVESWTESDDPEVRDRIREHVRQMADRLDEGRSLRRWDPLFAEIFEHADAIAMTIEDTDRGVRVVETSDDPDVVLLIQQHAHRAVSEFVERGMDRAHEPTPLPDGYR